MTFKDLGLSAKVLSAVETAGYETPTPIQEQAIPVALEGRDVLGIAQTGTGKTASFTLPMLTQLETGRARARMPRSLILEPTRELAAQVEQSFLTYGANHKLTIALLIGGVSFAEQNRKLDRGADVLIATPGRLLDHVERGKLMLNGVEILVIDEADRMLDMGFIPDIERICKLIPFTRQTLFFSATMPPEIQRLTDTFLQNPKRIEVARPSSTVENVTQKLVFSSSDSFEKRETLRKLLREPEVKNAIVFCNRKRDVATLYASLQKHGFNAAALHGDMDQYARMATLTSFRDGTVAFLIASDVAARGLDIPDVSHVLNFDVPIHAEDYVHRIGRTGRAGREGHALTIITPADTKAIGAIEKLIALKLEWQGDAPTQEQLEAGARGRRRSSNKRTAPSTVRKAVSAEKQENDTTSPSRPKRRKTEPQPADSPLEQSSVSEVAVQTKPEASPEAAPAADRPEKSPKGAAPSNKQKKKETETSAFGAGGHVPAFLQRPVRISQ